MSDTDWCGNFGCGKCYDCKCHQIGILLSRSESLERQLEEARELEKKAFWSGFELSKMNPDDMDIQKHWRHYSKLKETGDE